MLKKNSEKASNIGKHCPLLLLINNGELGDSTLCFDSDCALWVVDRHGNGACGFHAIGKFAATRCRL
jgi:hypothetical protein